MKNYVPKENVSVQQVEKEKADTGDKNEISKNNNEVTNVKQEVDDYLGVIEIPKISLKRYLYKTTSVKNDVDKNIEVLKSSEMPDVDSGNLILAAHNGNSSVGHFRNLHRLTLGDEVIIHYNNVDYTYKISKIYDVLKTGQVAIKRDKTQNTLTLITCLGSDRQLVVIGYLK